MVFLLLRREPVAQWPATNAEAVPVSTTASAAASTTGGGRRRRRRRRLVRLSVACICVVAWLGVKQIFEHGLSQNGCDC